MVQCTPVAWASVTSHLAHYPQLQDSMNKAAWMVVSAPRLHTSAPASTPYKCLLLLTPLLAHRQLDAIEAPPWPPTSPSLPLDLPPCTRCLPFLLHIPPRNPLAFTPPHPSCPPGHRCLHSAWPLSPCRQSWAVPWKQGQQSPWAQSSQSLNSSSSGSSNIHVRNSGSSDCSDGYATPCAIPSTIHSRKWT